MMIRGPEREQLQLLIESVRRTAVLTGVASVMVVSPAFEARGQDLPADTEPARPPPAQPVPFGPPGRSVAPLATPGSPLPPPTTAPAYRGQVYLPPRLPQFLQRGIGLQVGQFVVGGGASATLAYDDNANTESGSERQDEARWNLGTSLTAQSRFDRHALGFFASAGGGDSFDDPGDGEVNWLVGSNGRLDLSRQDEINGSLTYTRRTDDSESLTTARRGSGTANEIGAGLGYGRVFDRYRLDVPLTLSRTDYEDAEDSDRDRSSYGVAPSLGYRLSDRTGLSVFASWNRSVYDEEPDRDDEASGSSQAVSAGIGASRVVSARLQAQAQIGYSYVFSEESGRDDAYGVIGALSLAYGIDPWTAVNFTLSRSVNQNPDLNGSTASYDTAATLSVDRALNSYSGLNASIGYQLSEYEGDEEDSQSAVASLGYGYSLTERVALTASYRYSQRFDEEAFRRNVFLVGVSVSL